MISDKEFFKNVKINPEDYQTIQIHTSSERLEPKMISSTKKRVIKQGKIPFKKKLRPHEIIYETSKE